MEIKAGRDRGCAVVERCLWRRAVKPARRRMRRIRADWGAERVSEVYGVVVWWVEWPFSGSEMWVWVGYGAQGGGRTRRLRRGGRSRGRWREWSGRYTGLVV